MRASVTSLSKKLISTFFAATLALGLVPVAAFAANDENSEAADAARIDMASDKSDAYENEPADTSQDESVGRGPAPANGEAGIEDNAITGDDSNLSIPAATQRINETLTLQTRTVAQAESTRNYFLAQTLESTRTVPIVSANLPLDTGDNADNEASREEEGDDGEDDPDAADPSLVISAVSPASTVIGSFTSNGITYAVEPGGETVAVVAVDYNQLPEQFIENQLIVIPSVATVDGLDYYTITRIADYAFASLVISSDSEKSALLIQNREADTTSREDDEATDDELVGITAIAIPASVTSIGDNAFAGCDTLQYLIVSDDNPNYSSYDGALYDADQLSLLLIPEGRLGAVRIAPSVTSIDPEVFSHCPSVDTLVADPDSAAYQLLEANDFYNANNTKIEVIVSSISDQAETLKYEALEILSDSSPRNLVSSLTIDSSNSFFAIPATGTLQFTLNGGYLTRVTTLSEPLSAERIGETTGVYWETFGSQVDIHTTGRVDMTNVDTGERYCYLPARDNYEFAGWEGYPLGMVHHALQGAIPLNALWRPIFTINPNGGSIKVTRADDRTVELENAFNTTKGITGERDSVTTVWGNGDIYITRTSGDLLRVCYIPVRSHYTISGWKNETTGEIMPMNGEVGYWNFTDPTTFTAQWSPNGYSIMLDANDGVVEHCIATIDMVWGTQVPDVRKPPTSLTLGKIETYSPSLSSYVFDGFWTERVGGKQYYDENCNAVVDENGNTVTWNEPESRTTLYAHWKYDIVLDTNVRNFINTNGDTVTASIDWSSIPEIGEGYEVVTKGGATCIEALFGASIPMPTASREGYNPTRGWGLSSGTDGRASWVMRLTSDNLSAKVDGASLVATDPTNATYVRNGAGASTYDVQPNNEHVLTLYANWDWDVSISSSDKDELKTLGGGKKTYKVRLLSTYDMTSPNISYVSDWAAQGKLLNNVEYDSVISNTVLNGVSAPVFKSATGYANLRFKGFYTYPNAPTAPLQGVRLIAPSASDPTTLVGTTEPMRLTPATDDGEIVLWAYWTLPKTDVVFHLNLDGEAPLDFATASADTASLVWKAGKVFMVSPETNSLTPTIAGDIPKPTNGTYVFNGWWTHPYKERGEDTKQYYGPNNEIKEGVWTPYLDTVLYAHWTFDIDLDPKDALLKSGLTVLDNGEYYDGYGNRYDFVDDDLAKGLENIHAQLGAPIYLPEAQKLGYDPTTDWGAGATDDDGRTVDPKDPAVSVKPDVSAPDALGKVYLTPNFDGKAQVFTVTLDAGAGALTSDATAWTNQVLTGVTYDKTLPAVGITSVNIPFKNGHTFAGFQDASGKQYVNADGTTANVDWTTTSADKNVTLTAIWAQDQYTVQFNVANPNQGLSAPAGIGDVSGGTALGTRTWTWNAPISGVTYPAPENGMADPSTLSASQFYRNGYDFCGWYWLEDGVQRTVSDADGNATASFAPSFAWQQKHKGETVTLYAEWTPKVYALVFDTNYQERAKVPPAPYVEVAYGNTVTPYKESGAAAIPTDAPFTFAGWKWQSGADSWMLFADAPATTTSGVFLPAWPLSTLDKGNPGVIRTVTFNAQWDSPGKVDLVLSAGTHGRFTASSADLPGTLVTSDATRLVFSNVDYADAPFDLMKGACSPTPDDGFTLLGFVRTDKNGYLLGIEGAATKTPYGSDGNVREDVLPLLVDELSKLREDTYALAVYSADAMTVKLEMDKANVSFYAGYDDFVFYDLVGASYVKQATPKTDYAFDVRDGAFTLPADVVVPGLEFLGWVPAVDVTATPSKDVVIDPAAIAEEIRKTGDKNLFHQIFYPRFEAKNYTVAFYPNYGDGKGMDTTKTALVSFDGKVVDPGSFTNLKAGDVLAIAPLPSPRTTSGGDDATHYASMPFTGWSVGSDIAGEGVLQKPDAKPASTQWREWIAKYADMVPDSSHRGELGVYALWATGISATLPLTANVAIDPNTARVAIVEDGYEIACRGSELEVTSLRYQSLKGDASRGGNAFKLDGDNHAKLTVFANAATTPDMGEPTVDRYGFVSGTYGVTPTTLMFDLNADDVVISGADLKTKYGFDKFSAGDACLKMHYGLYLDGIHIDKVRALKAGLPDIKGAKDERTWTVASVPVARLIYTVQLAE